MILNYTSIVLQSYYNPIIPIILIILHSSNYISTNSRKDMDVNKLFIT